MLSGKLFVSYFGFYSIFDLRVEPDYFPSISKFEGKSSLCVITILQRFFV